jgi:hypothetical protein
LIGHERKEGGVTGVVFLHQDTDDVDICPLER